MTHLTTRKTLVAAALAATVSLPSAAQNVLEEVIVVAQKREESLQEVPIAISANAWKATPRRLDRVDTTWGV